MVTAALLRPIVTSTSRPQPLLRWACLRAWNTRIGKQCVVNGREGDYINYVKGANIAGFLKVATAMLEQGVL